MKESKSALSVFPKVVIGIIGVVAAAGVLTVVISMVSEKKLRTAKSVTYEALSMNAPRQSMLQGAFWELDSIESIGHDGEVVETYTLITDIMEHCMGYDASYYYSFSENAVIGFFPLDEPQYAIELWKRSVGNEYAILMDVVPALDKEYDKYKKNRDNYKVSEKFKSLCTSLGVPFPSIAVESYEWHDFKDKDLMMSLSYDLEVTYVDAERMTLSCDDNNAILYYKRIKKLPQEVAPITLYFHEKSFFEENYEKIESSKWKLSDEEIDAHFRKTFKSKKYKSKRRTV